MHQISDTVTRKFTDILTVDDFEIETDTGWVPITHLCKTIPYDVWRVETESGKTLECADDHILFYDNFEQVFTKNIVVGKKVITKDGLESIKNVVKTDISEQMFDVRVNHPNHRFWSGGFLSHNTTIINSICYALYNKPFDNISLQRLINSTNKIKNTQMEVHLEFEKGEDVYIIHRYRGEVTDIKITKNNEDITLDSVVNNDAAVIELVGISYELFTRVIIFSGASIPFLMLPVSQQRGQIEELFSITILSEKAVKLKEQIKAAETDISIQEAVIKERKVQVAAYDKQVGEAQVRVDRWEREQNDRLQQLKDDLSVLESFDMEAEKLIYAEIEAEQAELKKIDKAHIEAKAALLKAAHALENHKKDVAQANRDIEAEIHQIDADVALSKSKIDKDWTLAVSKLDKRITVEITQLDASITSSNKSIKDWTAEEKKLSNEIAHLIDAKCPYCQQKYEVSGESIEDKKRTVVSLGHKIATTTDAVKVLTANKTALQNEQKVEEKKLSDARIKDKNAVDAESKTKKAVLSTKLVKPDASFDEAVDAANQEVSAKFKEIKASEKKINSIKQRLKFDTPEEAHETANQIVLIKSQISESELTVNPHVEARDELLTNPVVLASMDEIDALKRTLEHQQFLLKLLINKDSFIRRKIINRTIPFLNKRLIYYTRELGLPHVVKFDDDMSCAVSEYGRELDFGNLSSGEKKRVNFSLAMAFRDVHHHLHSKFNGLFIDEIDASLDTSGVELMFKLIKQKTRDENLSTWVISHRPEAIGRFDRTLTIRKESGFSRIVNPEELEEVA